MSILGVYTHNVGIVSNTYVRKIHVGVHIVCIKSLVFVSLGANKVARIVNQPQSVGTMIGHTISLNCEVENTENRAVSQY